MTHNIYPNKRFNSLLPNGYNLYRYVETYETEHTVFYINKSKLDKIHFDKSFGHVEFITGNGETTITNIETSKKYRGNGIGSFLILVCADYCKHTSRYIELDDMSDFPWTKKNIYLKLGFHYLNGEPEPEMKGLSSIISNDNNLDRWKHKYLNSGFF